MPTVEQIFLPTSTAPNGIHVSAELLFNAMHLRSHRIGWAADCMERAAKHINALESDRIRLLKELEGRDAAIQEG